MFGDLSIIRVILLYVLSTPCMKYSAATGVWEPVEVFLYFVEQTTHRNHPGWQRSVGRKPGSPVTSGLSEHLPNIPTAVTTQ